AGRRARPARAVRAAPPVVRVRPAGHILMTRAPEPDTEGLVARASVIHPGLAPDLVYLDYNATTPVYPRVVEAMLPYLTTHFGNPSSAHAYAAAPRHALDAARTLVAELIGAVPAEPVFTAAGAA